MSKNKTELSPIETVYLASFRKGMDQADCGWLHEMAPCNKTTSGTVSSLIKKGLIDSRFDPTDSGIAGCYWLKVTDAGKAFDFSDKQLGVARDLTMGWDSL